MPVRFNGPLFDGRAAAALRAGMDEGEQRVAVEAREAVRGEIRRRARQRTGYYESRVRIENLGGDRVVNASGVIYDDWLQRGGWRGSSFAGYRQWDTASSAVDARAAALVAQTLKPYIERMG